MVTVVMLLVCPAIRGTYVDHAKLPLLPSLAPDSAVSRVVQVHDTRGKFSIRTLEVCAYIYRTGASPVAQYKVLTGKAIAAHTPDR